MQQRYIFFLIAALCATLAVIDGLRVSEIARSPRMAAGWRAYILERHTAFGDSGPVFQANVLGDHRDELVDIFGSEAVIVPLLTIQTTITEDDGTITSIRLLDSDAGVANLLPGLRGRLRDSDCGNGKVFLDRGVSERIGIASDTMAQIGSSLELVDSRFDIQSLQLFPAGTRVDGIRCTAHRFDQSDTLVNAALVLLRLPVDEVRISTLVAELSTDDGSFQKRWSLTPFEHAAEKAGQRRYGWLFGLEVLLGVLTLGVVILLRVLVAVGESGETWLRFAIGEQFRHRVRRHVASSMYEVGLVSGAAILFASAAVGLIVKLQFAVHLGIDDLLATVIPWVLAASAVVGALRFAVDFALDTLLGRHSRQVVCTRATHRRRPVLLTTLAAAALCSAICMPTLFLLLELQRHASMPPGYRTEGLYAAPLVLLDYTEETSQQWWPRLQTIRDELATVPGVAAVGFISPAPWDFVGTSGVVENEGEMILNVAVSAGSLSMLAPVGWNGREIVDEVTMSEVVVQNMSDMNRRHFIQPGVTIVGEIHQFRFSPLDETGRSAIIRSLRSGIGESVHLIIASTEKNMLPSTAVAAVLDRHRGQFAAGPVERVHDILHQRLAPVRTSAVLSVTVAVMALSLLAVALLVSVRLYAATHRRELAIRICLGAQAARLEGFLLIRCAVVMAAGWLLGSMAGLLIWHHLVELIRDYRLVQPWPSYWLLPVALCLILPYYACLTRSSLRRLAVSDALKA